jgi:hypothetical protein
MRNDQHTIAVQRMERQCKQLLYFISCCYQITNKRVKIYYIHIYEVTLLNHDTSYTAPCKEGMLFLSHKPIDIQSKAPNK